MPLLEAGADTTISDLKHKTPLIMAREHQGCVDLLEGSSWMNGLRCVHVACIAEENECKPLLLVRLVQAAVQEPERCYMLAKALGIVDGTNAIIKCPAATRAKRKRVEAAALYLRRRVEREEELPEVWVRRGEKTGCKAEELRAVAGHVASDIHGDLVVEVMEMLRP